MLLHRATLVLGVIVLALLQLCILTSQAAFARTVLILKSQPGDYIGQGERTVYRLTDGWFTVRPQYGGGFQVYFRTLDNGAWWYLRFVPPAGKSLAIGHYEDAHRVPFQSPMKPGLDISGNGRGCNQLTGRFLVSELLVDKWGNVKSLAIDFEQHCENLPPALYGSVRYRSDVSIEPRVSISDATALKGNAGTSDATIIASLSMPSASFVKARFHTADRTAVDGRDYQAKSGKIVFQPGVTTMPITVPIIGNRAAGGDRVFAVRLFSAATPVGNGLARVQIRDPNVPQSVLTMNSQSSDYIGLGRTWLVTTADTTIAASRNSGRGVTVTLANPGRWGVDMAGPNGRALEPRAYRYAERFPFQQPGAAGLDVSGEGRGCNTLTGRFVVNEVHYAQDGGVEDFSADFEQHCEDDAPALFGAVRVNTILHQASLTNAVIVDTAAVFTVTLNPPGTASETVQFSTFDGTALAGVDYRAVSKDITFAPGETRKIVRVPLLGGAQAGKQFFGGLSSTRTPLWIRVGSATIE